MLKNPPRLVVLASGGPVKGFPKAIVQEMCVSSQSLHVLSSMSLVIFKSFCQPKPSF